MGTTKVFAKEDKGKVTNNGRYVPERIEKLRDRLLSTTFKLDIERAKYYTRAYKQTEGQPPCLRTAKGFEETLCNMAIRIEKEEQIVGSKSQSRERIGLTLSILKRPQATPILCSPSLFMGVARQ